MMRHILIIGLCLSLSACVSSSGDGDGNGNNNTPMTDTVTAVDTFTSTDSGMVADTAQPMVDAGPAVDTATPPADTGTPPQAAGLICPAMFNCVNTEMQKNCGGAPTQQCQNQAISTCAGMGKVPEEGQLFQAALNCQINCVNKNQGYSLATFECMSAECLQAQSDCYSGAVYGAAGCADIGTCSQSCQLDSSGECLRSCFQASTKEASFTYHDILFCGQGACVDKIQTPQFEPCVQTEASPNGACADKVATCGM